MKGNRESRHGVFAGSVFGIVGALACVAALSGCTVEAKTPPNPFAGGQPVKQTAAKAMGAEGTWIGTCLYENGAYNRLTMKFQDNAIAMTAEVFYSSTCSGSPIASAKFDATMVRAGSSFYVTGGHDIEVTTVQSGAATMQRAVFLIESGILYMSDSDDTVAGQWPTKVDRTKPYYRL